MPRVSQLCRLCKYCIPEILARTLRYVGQGDRTMDNNAAENAIRPFVIGP
ncbi:hypothetical protein DKW60_12035 [Leucothrix pacifica]|uniref:Transposase IS66 central domain-containing protein n=1 Tax=Leucothrix pacifica TaxID=1247513 RepID=A0A317CDT2_9GAMM|nr:hypothetical protein DKW60_12035 [Leucothrix pacifica]